MRREALSTARTPPKFLQTLETVITLHSPRQTAACKGLRLPFHHNDMRAQRYRTVVIVPSFTSISR